MKVIAVLNQKGGVGKTTTAINVAASLARSGYRTLLIDLDPQANATAGLGFDSEELIGRTIGEVLVHEIPTVKEIQLGTYLPNLSLAPSAITLAQASQLLDTRHFKEQQLKQAIESIKDTDFVIIDCPPTLGNLTVNAIVASKLFLVPVTPGGFSVRGLGGLLDTMNSVKQRDKDWDYRVLMTMVMGQAKVTNSKIEKDLEPVRERILVTQIQRNETVNQAQSGDTPRDITAYDKKSQGAKDYQALTEELLKIWAV